MNRSCDRFDELLDGGARHGDEATRWREHLRRCRRCCAQATSDAALRQGFAAPPPELSCGFETRLRRRLDARRTPARWRPAWGWTLAVYVTAATLASIVILSHLSWQIPLAPRGLGLTVVALVVFSPLLLFDRAGILRPPG